MMPVLFEKKSACFGCEACAAACPFGAIVMERDAEGFVYPSVDESLCSGCGACLDICPGKHPIQKSEYRAYAVRCRDPETLYRSTSGGAFSLIASQVLKEHGLVCGAVFDEKFCVVHVLSDDIAPMRKPKYVQSSTGGCFAAVGDALRAGRKVLFSGTPCQCHGVKNLFGRYPGLILVSLVCRGVQSPAFWEEYKNWLEREGRLNSFCFRDKRKPNDAHTVAYTLGGEEITAPFMSDPFCRIYLKVLALRPSCYNCPYCFPDKDFDFTIGDFWGSEMVFPDLADGKGTSLVLAGSERARAMMEELRSSADVRDVDSNSALQEALIKPPKESILRKFFFRDFAQKGLDGNCDISLLLKKYGA